MGSPKGNRRQINGWMDAELYDRISRAARKAEMSRSTYVAAFLSANIDVIGPEGAVSEQDSE